MVDMAVFQKRDPRDGCHYRLQQRKIYSPKCDFFSTPLSDKNHRSYSIDSFEVSSFTIPDGIIHDRLSIKSSNNDSTGVLEYLDKMKEKPCYIDFDSNEQQIHPSSSNSKDVLDCTIIDYCNEEPGIEEMMSLSFRLGPVMVIFQVLNVKILNMCEVRWGLTGAIESLYYRIQVIYIGSNIEGSQRIWPQSYNSVDLNGRQEIIPLVAISKWRGENLSTTKFLESNSTNVLSCHHMLKEVSSNTKLQELECPPAEALPISLNERSKNINVCLKENSTSNFSCYHDSPPEEVPSNPMLQVFECPPVVAFSSYQENSSINTSDCLESPKDLFMHAKDLKQPECPSEVTQSVFQEENSENDKECLEKSSASNFTCCHDSEEVFCLPNFKKAGTKRSFNPIFLCQMLKHEKDGILASILCLLLFIGVFNEATGKQPQLRPHRKTYFAQTNASYLCTVHNEVSAVKWYFNGTLQELNNTVVIAGNGYKILKIENVPLMFNSTTIECEEVYINRVERSVPSFMLVQGILGPVFNLLHSISNMTAVNIFWSAPFSLNVTGSDIDIRYCVDIFNSSSSRLLHSDCDINKTHYSWEYIPELIACGWYEIQVKAFNPVGNSTASNTTAWTGEYKIFKVYKTDFTDKKFEYEIVLNQDFCPEITGLFISNQITSYSSRSPNSISFSLENYHHYGDLTLQIMSPNGESIRTPVLNDFKTYDINSFSIFNNINNTIGLLSSFFENSSANGVLYALFYTTDGNYDISKSLFYPVKKDIALMGITFSLCRGMYDVLAYDIDNNGVIQSSGLPSTSEITDIEGSLEMGEEYGNPQCSLEVVGHQVEVKCHCNDSYFQLVLLQQDNSITSKRKSCSQKIQVDLNQNENIKYNAIAFIEDASDGIFISRDSIFIKEFSVQQPSTKEYSHNNTITLVPVIAESFLIFLLAVLLVVIISYMVIKYKRRKKVITLDLMYM